MGSIGSLSGNLLGSVLNPYSPVTSSTSAGSPAALQGAGSSPQADAQLSPLAKLLGALQKLQQSDPAEYQALTKQIAASLASAAKADTASGDTAGASQLSQLAKDFTNASTSGQLPNIQDLAQALGGGSNSGTSHASSPVLAAYNAHSTQSASNDALSIILSVLTTAGISTAT